jgi:hypothetical protein
MACLSKFISRVSLCREGDDVNIVENPSRTESSAVDKEPCGFSETLLNSLHEALHLQQHSVFELWRGPHEVLGHVNSASVSCTHSNDHVRQL